MTFKKSGLLKLFSGVICSLFIVAFTSCGADSGLGSSVDTESPTLVINYPPASSVVCGTFVFSGAANDDKGLDYVKVTVKDSDSKELFTTNVTADKNGIWKAGLNQFDSENAEYYNGWQFADGTYNIYAQAFDKAGRSSGNSSYQTIVIDNSAPVLVITKPSTIGSDEPKEYGQAVQLQGAFSEMSNGGKINLYVDFYDESGKYLLSSAFENLTDISSANPLTIAQYYPDDGFRPVAPSSGAEYVKWNNYRSLYGDEYIASYEAYANGTSKEKPVDKKFYFTVTATDSARTYTDITNYSGTGEGNATSTYYRSTSKFQSLIEGKNEDFKGFSVYSLRNYLNKTDLTYSGFEALESILTEAISCSALQNSTIARSISEIGTENSGTGKTEGISDLTGISNTDASNGKVYLNFKVNPLNNPTFAVSGYLIDKSKTDDKYSKQNAETGVIAGCRSYTLESNLVLTISPGLDATKLKKSTVSIFVKNTATDEDILVWTYNRDTAVKYAVKKYGLSENDANAVINSLSFSSDVYRYEPVREDAVCDDIKLETSLNEKDGIVCGKTYVFTVAGEDNDGKKIVAQKTDGYGIWASQNAEPPVIKFGNADAAKRTNFSSDSIINSISSELPLHFSGTASSEIVLHETEGVTYEFTFSDSSDSSKSVKAEGTALYGTQSTSNPYEYTWSFDIPSSNISSEKLSQITQLVSNPGRYKLELLVKGKSNGGTSKESRSIIIDTKAPSVRNLSVTNSYSKNGTTYITGKGSYTLSGISSDNYELAFTSWKLTGKDIAGNAKTLEGKIESSENWEIMPDLSGFVAVSEKADIVFEVRATDCAGNISEPVTLFLELDTTAPVLKSDKIGGTEYVAGKNIWQKNTTIGIEGQILESQSGVKAVYYQIENDSNKLTPMTCANYETAKTGVIYTVSGSEYETFTQTLNSFVTGKNILRYVIADSLGNVSECYERNVMTDTVSPIVRELESSDIDYKSFSRSQFGKSVEGFSFAYLVYDADSGIDENSINVKVGDYIISKKDNTNGTLTVTTQNLVTGTNGTSVTLRKAREDDTDVKAGYFVKVSLKGAGFAENNIYTVTSNINDVAGNSSQTQVGIFSIDTTAPVVTVSRASGSALYVNGLKEISAVIKESGEVSEVRYQIFKAGDTGFEKPLEFYPVAGVSGGNVSFASEKTSSVSLTADTSVTFNVCTNGINSSVFGTESFVVRVSAKDSAGNEGNALSSAYIIDTAGPELTDDNLKDDEWYNATTLSAYGTWNDNGGSGASSLYYVLSKTPLGTEESPVTAETVKTNQNKKTVAVGADGAFNTNISGFETGTNYLYYAAVDAVGNTSALVSHTIQVDMTKPHFEGGSTETTTANSTSEKTFTVQIMDTGSGINTETIAADVGGIQIKKNWAEGETVYGTLVVTPDTTAFTGYENSYTVKVTASTSLMNALTEAKLNSVNLTVYDNAGNTDSSTIGYLKVDNTAPLVTVKKESGTNLYVKGEKTVTVAVSDMGEIAEIKWAVFENAGTGHNYDNTSLTAKLEGTATAGTSADIVIDFDTKKDGNFIFENDKEYVLCVKAKDTAGNECTYEPEIKEGKTVSGGGISSAYIVDRTGPTFVETDGDSLSDSNKWYNCETITASGKWSDGTRGSGASTVYYMLKSASSSTEVTPTVDEVKAAGNPVAVRSDTASSVAEKTGTFSVNISGFKDSQNNKLYYVAEDSLGNLSTEVTTHTVKVDTSKPEFKGVKASDGSAYPELTAKTLEAKGGDTKDFEVVVLDKGSGLYSDLTDSAESTKKITATVGGKTATVTYTSETQESGYASAGTVEVTASPEIIAELTEGVTHSVTVKVYDNAGNSNETTAGYLKVDRTAPKVTIPLESGKNLFVNGTDSSKGKKTFTATISDQGAIASIDWAVFEKKGDGKYDTATAVKSGTVSELSTTPSVEIDFTEKKDGSYIFAEDKEYVFCLKATDSAGNAGTYELSSGGKSGGGISSAYRVDRTAPSLSTDKIADVAYNADKWHTQNTLSVSGTWSDDSSGAKTLYYVLSQTEITPEPGAVLSASHSIAVSDSGTYEANISGFKYGTNYLYYVAEDYTGNVSGVVSHTIKIDDKAPLDPSSFTVNGKTLGSDESFYTNKGNTLTTAVTAMSIEFTVSDAEGGSGIDTERVYVLPYSKLSDNTETGENKATATENAGTVTFTKEISSSVISKSGQLWVRVYDKAGNSSDVNLFSFVLDTASPKLSSYDIKDENTAFTAYKKTVNIDGEEIKDHYYIHSGNSHVFTISGVATDNQGVDSIELTLKDSSGNALTGYPEQKKSTDTGFDASDWKFTGESLSGVAKAVITLTDKAGNTSEKTILFTDDTTPPAARHEYDANKKDLYFRIGEFNNELDEIKKLVTGANALDNNLDKDVGGKYGAGTWGTASTITIRGYWTETGSGVKTIYYKILNPTATDETALKEEISKAATEFASKYLEDSDGNFAPCAEVKKRVVYTKSLKADGSTDEQGTQEIPYSFKAAIPGFNAEKNYLLLVAVDNVGNAAIDSLGAAKATGVTTDVASENWNSGLAAFSLNVDTVAPSLISTTSGSQYTNKVKAITVSSDSNGKAAGTVTDSSSGVKSLVLTIDGIKDSNNKLIEIEAELTGKNGDGERNWKATIPTDVLSKLADSSKSYNVNATVTDVAGNKSSPAIFTLQVDTAAPEVSMVTPAYNKTTATAVNGRISLTGKTKYTGAAPDRFALYYTTVSPTESTTLETLASTAIKLDGSNAESSNEITDLNSITSWSYSNFDSYVVFGTDTTSATHDIYIIPVVYDDAGNCSIYSEVVTGTGDDATVTRTYSYTEGKNYFKYSVDKNSDRPIITLGNCDTSGTALKSTSKAYGTIEDDDGLTALHLFYIAKGNSVPSTFPTVENGSVTLNDWTECAITSGSWEIDSGAEGHFAYYLYAIDAQGGNFWSGNASKLNQMYIYNGVNDKAEKKDEKAGISFSADLNPPEIESIEIAHKELEANALEGWSAVTETFGPQDKELYLKLVVSEFIGLKESGSTTATELKDQLLVPEILIAGKKLSGVTVKSVTKQDYKYTFLFNKIDLSALEITGGNTLKAIVTDKSGFTGQGTIGINYDNTAPTIKIISPTAAISDAVIAATTVKGTAFDDYSSIKKLEYVIPLNSETYTKTSDNWIAIPGTTATWDIEFDSGSTESPSSLLYYAADGTRSFYKDVTEVAAGLGIYKVPFYFRTTDSVGNVAVHTKDSNGNPYFVYVNPDGGKPSAWINSPETGLTTSGSVTIYGGAMDNISVATVGIQIDANGDGVINDTDYTYISEHKSDFGISTTDTAALVESTKEPDGTTSKNDWYIKAKGTNSWKVMLKTSAIGDYSGETKTVSYTDSGLTKTLALTKSSDATKYKYLIVRVRAIDGEGNTRKYTNENYVVIDNSAPSFSNVRLVQFGKDVTASFTGSPVTEREYVSGMYISNITAANNGTWYLAADVKSKSEITSITAEKQTSETTSVIDLSSDGETSFVTKSDSTVTKNHAEAGTISETDTAAGITSYYQLLIPLKTSESGMIYAILKSNNDASSVGEQAVKINIDSTAPSLYTTGGAEKSDATTSENLRVKSQNKILGKDLDKNSVIENSDGYFTLGDTVKEAGSGLAWLAFYFENDVQATHKVYDPMIKVSGSTYGETAVASKTNGSLYINEDNLASLYLTGVTRHSETTLTLPSANTHVRKGGLVKIAGTYHTITDTDISGTEVSFTPAVSRSFTTVEVIYAQVVDHTVTENVTTDYNDEDVGTDRIENDDGDGMCENLTQQGSYYNWSAMVDSNNIPDGTTYIRVVAMDNAGNLSHGKIASMVANNRPRLTKVFIGTDLNGNGKFDFDADEGDAPVVSTSNKLRTKSGTSFGEFNYYTAYNTRSGVAQSKVTLESRAFKVIDGLCIVPEFTGGNGSLKYTLTNGTDLTPYTDGTLSDMISRETMISTHINNAGTLSLFGNTVITGGDNKNAVTYGITDSTSGVSYKDFGGIVIKDSETSVIHSTTDGEVKNVKVTFFDNTDSTDGAAHKEGQWATVVIPVTIKSSDSTVPEPKIKPFHWADSTDNSLYVKKNGTVYEAASAAEKNGAIAGHIELEGALPVHANLTTGLPKVSGVIKIEGTVYDDVRLEALSMSIFGGTNTKVASYTNGSWVNESSLPAGLVSFKAEDEDMSQNGHTVKYTAVVNTELLSDSGYPVGKAKWITVGASDWKHNYVYTVGDNGKNVTGGSAAFTGGTERTTGKTQTRTNGSLDADKRFDSGWTNCYSMDVVPYVTEIVTHLSSFYGTAHSVYARTAKGHYPCYEGEEIEFKGYNLGTDKAKVVIQGMATAGTALSSSNKVTLTATSSGNTGAKSGVISVSVNGIPAMNNINTNDACGSYVSDKEGRAYTDDNYAYCYNRQPNGVNNNTLTDDLELDVWQFKNAAKPVNGGAERVTMKINPVNGTPGFSYANSVLYFSMPGYSSDSTNKTAWRSENGTINGTYASQIPFGMNYGGFSHNSFTFDNQGYSYGAAMCTDTQNAKASAFFQFFSKETPILFNAYDQNMNYCNEANASRLDSSTMNVGTDSSPNWQCNINRIQSISMETSNSNGTSAATNDKPVYVFIAYYDAIVKQVRFRWGTVGAYSDSIDGKNNNDSSDKFDSRKTNAYGLDDIHDSKYTGRAEAGKDSGSTRPGSLKDSFVKYSDTNHRGIPVQVIAGSGLSYSGTHNTIYAKKDHTAGQYVSLSILGKDTASPTACVFWYDGSKLMMAYNSSPTTGKTWNYKTVDSDGGLHVKSCVDSDGGIHLAYYTSNGGNLKYAYMSGVNADPQIATVDANGAVGTKCTIDVAKNADGKQVPYITYQMIGGVYTYNAKIAYRTNFDSSLTTVPAGADSKDIFTGDWEVSVIPTEATRLLNDDTINVGVWRDSSGNAKAFTTNDYWKASDMWFAGTDNKTLGTVSSEDAATGVSNGTMDVGNPSLIYGNNTANPIVGYGIESGAIEIAQKK